MKKISKRISVCISLLLCISMFSSIQVFATEGSNEAENALEALRQETLAAYSSTAEQEAINECIDTFKNDDMFYQNYEYDSQDAIENVRLVLQDFISDVCVPYWYWEGIYGAEPSLIQQKEYYYCGPASALQIIAGFGLSGGVAGSDLDTKQDTLAQKMSTNKDGTVVYRLRQSLNSYVKSCATYK